MSEIGRPIISQSSSFRIARPASRESTTQLEQLKRTSTSEQVATQERPSDLGTLEETVPMWCNQQIKSQAPAHKVSIPPPPAPPAPSHQSSLKAPYAVVNPEFVDAVRAIEAGAEWGDYQILRPLGMGMTGATFEAIHMPSSTPVAIKLLDLPYDNVCYRRFHDVCGRLRGLTNLSVCKLIDHIWLPPYVALVSELLTSGDGQPLDLADFTEQLIGPEGFPSEPNALKVAKQLAAALVQLHRIRIVHGNLKPANVLFKFIQAKSGGWRLKLRLTDCGVAEIMGSHAFRQKLQPILDCSPQYDQPAIETCAFMGAEQWPRTMRNELSDQYSCSALIHYFLLGDYYPKRPRPSWVRNGLDIAWDPVLSKSLRGTPERRFNSMAEFAECLELIDA